MQGDGIDRAVPGLASLAADSLLNAGAAERLRGHGDEKEAARQMEALFMQMLVKELRKSIPGDGLFGKGPGSDVYEGWFDLALGQSLADGSGSGLRQSILQSLTPPATPATSKAAPGAANEARPDAATTTHQVAAPASEDARVSHDPTVPAAEPFPRSKR